ncbi:MAG TPA: hypothetical protein VJL84_03255 [Kiloniellales bacterium]|nr:hypothetical protein [Kiloniellales bacterium]
MLAGDAALLWVARREPCRPLLRPWFRLRVLTLILLAPLLYGIVTNMLRRAGHFWPPEFSWGALQSMLKVTLGARVYWGDPDHFLDADGEDALLWALSLCMVLGLFFARRRRSLLVVVALALLPQLLLIAISLHTSLMVGRYFAIATPPLVVLAALGLGGLWRRTPPVAAAFGAAVLALLFLQSLDAMQRSSKPRFDLAVARLREAGIERLGVSVLDEHLALSVMYHLRDDPKGVRLPPWLVFHAAERGLVVWVFSTRRSDPVWWSLAERNAVAVCRPALPGLRVLALAARPEDLASSCTADGTASDERGTSPGARPSP